VAAYSIVEGFECPLNLDRLGSVGIVEHHTNRRVSRFGNRLNSCVLLGDVVPVCCRVPPLDFNRI
jgi:hypothetical protein